MGGPAIGFGLLLFAVIVGAIVVSLVAAIVRWRDRVRTPCCGECRYPVEGLTSFTCPECGRDLREAGILVPGVRPRHRVHVAEMVAACAAVAVLGAVMTAGVLAATPTGRQFTFTRTQTLAPASGSFGQVNVSATARIRTQVGPLNTVPAQSMTISELPGGAPSPGGRAVTSTPNLLEVDLVRQTWRVVPFAGSLRSAESAAGTLPITSANVRAWLTSGPPALAGRVLAQDELDALAAYINSGGVDSAPVLRVASSAFTTSGGLAPWATWTTVTVWAALFGVATWLIWLSNRARPGRGSTSGRFKAAVGRAVPARE